VTEVLINVSQHPDQVREFLAARRDLPPHVTLVVEAEPRGTAGTVATHRDFVAGEENFWVLYSDNLTDVSLAAMSATHRRHAGVATVGLFRAPVPCAAGIVTVDAAGRIVGFEEKPANPKGDLANAGIYLARPELFDWIPVGPQLVDFAHDVFPALVGRLYGHIIREFLMDIGTPEALERAAAAWMRRRPPDRR